MNDESRTASAPGPIETLGDAFPKEIARNRELLKQYQEIGPSGIFGYTMILRDVEAAEKAWAEQDTVAMVRLYPILKEHE
jgi:hypothetical protein